MVASDLGIPKVGYVKTPPPPKARSPRGTRTIEVGGVIMTLGGGRGISSTI